MHVLHGRWAGGPLPFRAGGEGTPGIECWSQAQCPSNLSTRLCAQHLTCITPTLTIAPLTSQEIEVPRNSSYMLKITQFQGPGQLSSQAVCSPKQSICGQPPSYSASGLRVRQLWVACFRVIMERQKGSSKANKAFCGQPCVKEEGQGVQCPGEDGRTPGRPALLWASVTHTFGSLAKEAVLWWICIRLGGLALNLKTWPKLFSLPKLHTRGVCQH